MNAAAKTHPIWRQYAWVFLALSAAYVLILPVKAAGWTVVVKVLPCLFLSAKIWQDGKAGTKGLILGGMLFSTLGDGLLGILRAGGDDLFFMAGLGSFLVAHILYTIAFSKDRKFQKSRFPIFIALPAFAVAMVAILAPNLGDLLVPVMVYIAAIGTMAVFATLHATGGAGLIAGAMLFMLSDSVIALDKFVLDEPHAAAPYVIMVTYYAAQFLIARAFVHSSSAEN